VFHRLWLAAIGGEAQSNAVKLLDDDAVAGSRLVAEAEAALGLPAGALDAAPWFPELLVGSLCVALSVAAGVGAAWAARRVLAVDIGRSPTDPSAGWLVAAPGLLGTFVTALGLWISMALFVTDGRARPFIALALGGSVGWLAYLLARRITTRAAVAPACGLGAFLLVLMAVLGSFAPLRAGLDSVGLHVAGRLITPLDFINALVLGGALFGFARISIQALERWVARMPGLDPSHVVLVSKIGGLAIIALVVLVGIDFLGIDLTALKFFSGALGLAVGFGLQKTFGNLIAGLILLMDRSIKPGDVIVVGDSFGWVNRIGVRAVSVLTRDGKEHLIPNELLMTERVENWSYSDPKVRVHIPVGVAYDSDIVQVEALLLDAALTTPRVLKDPAPVCWLQNFGESSVDFDLIVWIADPEQGTGNVRSDILKSVWHSFHAHGVTIPFPQRDVHLRAFSDQSASYPQLLK
jgi:small-conductance mechanosensitive channel